MKINIQLMYGLPGSGKTTLAKEMGALDHYKTNSIYIDCDSFQQSDDMIETLEMKIHRAINALVSNQRNENKQGEIIIDGLFINTAGLEIIRTVLANILNKKQNQHSFQLIINYFIPDRETCLWNDKYRDKKRGVNSNITITQAQVDVPKIDIFDGLPIITVIQKHTVKRCPDWLTFAKKIGAPNGSFRSDSWTTGGTYGSCWSDEKYELSPDEAPVTFEAFDFIMEEFFPNITYLEYKRLSKAVRIKTDSESDYYGGLRRFAYYECDVAYLYELLLEKNLIDLNTL